MPGRKEASCVENEEKEILAEEEMTETNIPDAEAAEASKEEESASDAQGAETPPDLSGRVAELEDQLLRKIAEFDNYRNRTLREKDEIGLNVRIQCVAELLPVLDNFERALAIGCSDEGFFKGVQLIFSSLSASFAKMGVEEIPAEGRAFDPELHYAVGRVENPELGPNTVAAVMQKGYRMGGKVVRHAMVAVANAD